LTPTLNKVPMMSGAVMLVAPQGYCVDRSSLKPGFALMARCDTLGADGSVSGAPLGLITASVVAADGTQPLPDAEQMKAATDIRRVLQSESRSDRLVFQAEAPAPFASLSERHWRAAARLEGHIIAVAVYSPQENPANGADGKRILTRLIERTQRATAVLQSKTAASGDGTVEKNVPTTAIAGLSE
jgi:hypothetical protein